MKLKIVLWSVFAVCMIVFVLGQSKEVQELILSIVVLVSYIICTIVLTLFSYLTLRTFAKSVAEDTKFVMSLAIGAVACLVVYFGTPFFIGLSPLLYEGFYLGDIGDTPQLLFALVVFVSNIATYRLR